jgi:hypothetical protein
MSCDLGQTRIQLNTAKAAYEAAKQDFEQCQPPEQRSAARMEAMKEALGRYETEAAQLIFMNEFLLNTLDKEAGNNNTVVGLGEIAERQIQSIQDEIEQLKSEIRKERRRFLDSGPQVSPAVAGLYFTKVPDNQVLIGLLTCIGAFLIVVSICVIMGLTPIEYLNSTTAGGERWKIVGAMWVMTAIVTYMGLYIFT